MWLRNDTLIRSENHLRLVVINMQRTKNKYKTGERRVRRDRPEPIIIQIEQHHLRLRGLQDQITQLLNLECRLERKLQFGGPDNDVGEVEKMDFERIQHTLSGDDDLMRLLFDRQ